MRVEEVATELDVSVSYAYKRRISTMPVFKNESNNTWYVMARYVNWKGERKQKCKRGFSTKREAQEWERTFQQQNAADMDMSFEAFTQLYEKDIRPRLKENTWLTKEHIIKTKRPSIISSALFSITLLSIMTCVPIPPPKRAVWATRTVQTSTSGQRTNIAALPRK